MKKERWIWYCYYDTGSGLDRESCNKKCRKIFNSKEKAENSFFNHLDNCKKSVWHKCNGCIKKLLKYERFG